MILQQSIQTLSNAVTTASVIFPMPFLTVPELVVPAIQNTIDGSPLFITAVVTAKSLDGFTVKLSAATNSANYSLSWVAGVSGEMAQISEAVGIRISEVDQFSGTPPDSSYFPFVNPLPTPTTQVIRWVDLASNFGQFVTTPPAAPTSPGILGNWSVDTNFFYSHDGVKWGRTLRVGSNWDIAQPAEFFQTGSAALTQDVRTVSVTFAEPFDTAPFISFNFENTAVGTKQMITGIVTTVSASGFTVTLNTTPDTAAYLMKWRAVGNLTP